MAGFHEANSAVNIGTVLENIENLATMDWYIMSKISAANK